MKNNENTTPVASVETETAVKQPVYRRKPIVILLSILLALLIAGNTVLIVFMALKDKGSDETTQTPVVSDSSFDYSALDINAFLPGFSASMVTGNVIAGAEAKVDDVDDEAVIKYINSLLLNNKTPEKSGKVNKTEAISYADSVYLYVLYISKDGETIDVDYFNNAYAQGGEYVVGAETFGEDFDSKLIGLIPRESGTVEYITVGDIADGDVLCVTYEATIDGEEKAYKGFANERWDLSALKEDKREAVLENCKAIGQQFTFDLTEDIDEDGDEELVHYKATVSAIALEENVYTLKATLPEDYFGKSMDEKYTALNGQEIEFHIVIDYSVAYTVVYESSVEKTDENGKKVTEKVSVNVETFDKLTAEYIKATLGYDHGAAGSTAEEKDAAAREKYFAHIKEQLTESYESSVRTAALSLIWNHLLDTLSFTSLPEEAKTDNALEVLYELENTYNTYAYQYSDFKQYYPTLEDFARYMFGYTEEEYANYSDYVNGVLAVKVTKQNMLYAAIYNRLGVKDDTAKYNTVRARLIEELKESAASQGTTITDEEAVKYFNDNYGATYLDQMIMQEMVEDYLVANNTIDWELSADKAE